MESNSIWVHFERLLVKQLPCSCGSCRNGVFLTQLDKRSMFQFECFCSSVWLHYSHYRRNRRLTRAFFREMWGLIRKGSCKTLPSFAAATNTSSPARQDMKLFIRTILNKISGHLQSLAGRRNLPKWLRPARPGVAAHCASPDTRQTNFGCRFMTLSTAATV